MSVFSPAQNYKPSRSYTQRSGVGFVEKVVQRTPSGAFQGPDLAAELRIRELQLLSLLSLVETMLKASKQTDSKKTTSLTFHFILRQVNRGPVGEDIWNSAKSLVHEPGGHSTHWHFCEGKATTVSRSSYSLALRSFDKPFATVLDLLGKRNSSKWKEVNLPSAEFNLPLPRAENTSKITSTENADCKSRLVSVHSPLQQRVVIKTRGEKANKIGV